MEWDPPIHFDQFNLPPFPTAVFPLWLRAFVEAEATATQTPPDLASMLALSVIATACAKRVRIEVKPGYQEPLNLFTVSALPPGNRKSAVFKHIVKPVEDYEREQDRRTALEIAQKQAARKIKESKLKKVQEKAASAKGLELDSLTEQASSLAAELAATPVSVPTRCIADDCTPEKLITLLGDQGGRIAVLSPEGDVFELMAGRYSANGKANFGVYLKGHAGDSLRVDRVGRAPDFINQPAVTLGLTVQPEVIRGLAMNPGFRGRGLLGRFLYSLPTSPLGFRDTNPPPVPEEICEIYRGALLVLLNLATEKGDDGEPAAHVLRLEVDALQRFQRFEAWVEPQLSEFGDLGRMTDWGGKLVGAVARITGLLHMAEHAGAEAPWDIPVSAATVERAIRVGTYLIEHAKAAFAEMGADEVVERAKAILRWIEHNELDTFTRRQDQGMRGTFARAAEVDPPLALLAERGFVRKRAESQTREAGRPASVTFDVNPLWSKAHWRQVPTGILRIVSILRRHPQQIGNSGNLPAIDWKHLT
jgi:replicative DNA helicase